MPCMLPWNPPMGSDHFQPLISASRCLKVFIHNLSRSLCLHRADRRCQRTDTPSSNPQAWHAGVWGSLDPGVTCPPGRLHLPDFLPGVALQPSSVPAGLITQPKLSSSLPSLTSCSQPGFPGITSPVNNLLMNSYLRVCTRNIPN